MTLPVTWVIRARIVNFLVSCNIVTKSNDIAISPQLVRLNHQLNHHWRWAFSCWVWYAHRPCLHGHTVRTDSTVYMSELLLRKMSELTHCRERPLLCKSLMAILNMHLHGALVTGIDGMQWAMNDRQYWVCSSRCTPPLQQVNSLIASFAKIFHRYACSTAFKALMWSSGIVAVCLLAGWVQPSSSYAATLCTCWSAYNAARC